MTTTNVFTTPIYYDERAGDEELNRDLTKLIRSRADSEQSDDKFRAHQGGYYSTGEFFNDPAPCVKSVTQVIRAGLGSYFRDLGVSQTVTT